MALIATADDKASEKRTEDGGNTDQAGDGRRGKAPGERGDRPEIDPAQDQFGEWQVKLPVARQVTNEEDEEADRQEQLQNDEEIEPFACHAAENNQHWRQRGPGR